MKDYAEQFYKSRTWRKTREAYATAVNHLCENCLKNGLIEAGEIVHHKEHITPNNIDDPDITLSFDNLELLCRKCHGAIHGEKRYTIDADGRVTPLDFF